MAAPTPSSASSPPAVADMPALAAPISSSTNSAESQSGTSAPASLAITAAVCFICATVLAPAPPYLDFRSPITLDRPAKSLPSASADSSSPDAGRSSAASMPKFGLTASKTTLAFLAASVSLS